MEKFLDHLHANKPVCFIHQVAKHTDMAADAKNLYRPILNDIVENLALKPSPATKERFQPMFTSLLTKLKTYCVSGTISAGPVKSDPSFFNLLFAKLAMVKTGVQSVYYDWRASDGGSGGDVRGGGRGKGPSAKTTLSSSPPEEHEAENSLLLTTILSVDLVTHMDISLVTVRTANQRPLLLRRSMTPHGPRRTKRKRLRFVLDVTKSAQTAAVDVDADVPLPASTSLTRTRISGHLG